jgi:flagellar protein FlgJ
MISPILHTGLSVDPKSLGDLHTRAVKDPQGALREAARQFEALMLDRMVKSMRTAAPGDSLFDGEGTRMFTELLDHEYAAKLAAQGGLGLADMLVRQLSQALHPSGQEIPKSADK